jgi:hypothetical protein
MRTSAGLARAPFALVLTMYWRDTSTTAHTVRRYARKGDATTAMRDSERAWLSLIGGQRSPLVWSVVDERTFRVVATTHPRLHGGSSEPEQDNEGRLF